MRRYPGLERVLIPTRRLRRRRRWAAIARVAIGLTLALGVGLVAWAGR